LAQAQAQSFRLTPPSTMYSYRQAGVVVLLACMGVINGTPAPSIEHESFKVLPALLKPQMLERFEHETNGFFTYSCGHWCDSDVALLRQHIAEQLHLPPSQLGDVRLEDTTQFDPSLHPSWDGAAIAYLTKPDQIRGMIFVNADGSKADVDHESMFGSVVVMPSVTKAIFRSQVKLMVIPVLRQVRPFMDYYISTGLWEALVSTHRAGRVLGLDFFRAHTRYPLFWHACVWSALGSAVLVLLGVPLIWRPMLRLVEAIEKRFEAQSPQKTDPPVPPRGPTLLEKRKAQLPLLPSKSGGESSPCCYLGASPCTPGTQHLNFMT